MSYCGVDFVSRSGLSSAVCNGTLQLAGETRRLDMENWLSEMGEEQRSVLCICR